MRELTRHPNASLKEILVLSLPLILTLISGSLMNLCDRAFLSRYSFIACEGCVSASFLLLLFQAPSVRIASIAQVFVGQKNGAGQPEIIGRHIWQMIWFSLLTSIVITPVGLIIGYYYFSDTVVAVPATTYFNCLLLCNFLFPLAATLSAFFIGLGRTSFIVWATILAQLINIPLNYFLLFSTPLGVLGVALGTAFSQAILCAILLFDFLSKKNQLFFGTASYQFDPKLFWEIFKVGLPSALGKLVYSMSWALMGQIMMRKGGTHLAALTTGSTAILLFCFIYDGFGKTIVTVSSHLLGANRGKLIPGMIRSALSVPCIISVILTIPFLFYPELFFSLFKLKPTYEEYEVLSSALIWIWFFSFSYALNSITSSVLTAFKDTLFYMIMSCLSWIDCLLLFFVMNTLQWSGDKMWLMMAISGLVISGMQFLRIRSKLLAEQSGEKLKARNTLV